MASSNEATGPGYTWMPYDPARPERPRRWVLAAIVAPIVALIVMNNIGAVLFTSSLRASGGLDNPLQILALNSTNKILLGTATQAPLIWFIVISSLRLLAPDPLFYLLGYLYRAPALNWGRRVFPGSDRLFDLFEREDHRGVQRLLDVLVVVMPNNPVCLLAGIARMPVRRFAVLNVVGTLGRVLLFAWLGHLFRRQINDIMSFVANYQKWAIAATVIVVVATFGIQASRLISSTEELAEDE